MDEKASRRRSVGTDTGIDRPETIHEQVGIPADRTDR